MSVLASHMASCQIHVICILQGIFCTASATATMFDLGKKLAGIKLGHSDWTKPSAGINYGYLPRHAKLADIVPVKISGSTLLK